MNDARQAGTAYCVCIQRERSRKLCELFCVGIAAITADHHGWLSSGWLGRRGGGSLLDDPGNRFEERVMLLVQRSGRDPRVRVGPVVTAESVHSQRLADAVRTT